MGRIKAEQSRKYTQGKNLGVLATSCGQAVHVLVLACAHFGRDQNNLHGRQRKFLTACTPNRSQTKLSDVHLLANEIQDKSTLKWDLQVLVSPFGHPIQISTQDQLVTTCEFLWPGLNLD